MLSHDPRDPDAPPMFWYQLALIMALVLAMLVIVGAGT